MKNKIVILLCSILGIFLFFLLGNYGKREYPNEFYNVYLEGELLGTIKSKEDLENYINEKANHYINVKINTTKYYLLDDNGNVNTELAAILENTSKDNIKYGSDEKGDYVNISTQQGDYIDKVYTPSGLSVDKVLTHKGELSTIEDIFELIQLKKPFTIKGYQFTIKKDEEVKYIYVTDESIFESAVKDLIETYAGEKEYASYINETQEKIKTTGSTIENIYIDEEITVKERQIPINAKIYSESAELAQFLLFGNDAKTNTYTVKEGEMITDISRINKISTKEFLISNPEYRNINRLIKAGTKVNIKETNPQLNVVVEQFVVEDKVSEYKTIVKYDDTQFVNVVKKVQDGSNGMERVSQKIKIVNGEITFIEPKGKEILKQTIDEIIIKGDKPIPSVGDLNNWGWPTDSGYTITSDYAWRLDPFTGERKFHNGTDIGGFGYGANIYAANNGVVITKQYAEDFGNYVVINHNNGYYTLYAHMNKFANIQVGDIVQRGQVIGYIGSTGWSTGPHLHFEVWKGCKFCRVSTWSIYR